MDPRRSRVLLLVFSAVLCCSLASADEEKRTEVLTLHRIEAQQSVVAIRVMAGAREIEVIDAHRLSVHDEPAKLVLARKVVEMLDREEATPSTFDVGDGTTLASLTLKQGREHEASRMLMSQIDIRRVATVQELALVFVRDSPEQVGKALELLRDFDRQVP